VTLVTSCQRVLSPYNRCNSLHADIRRVALAERRSTVRRRRERRRTRAVRSSTSVAAASAIVKREAHRDVVARDTREVALAEVGGREVALEQSAASAVGLAALASLTERTAGEPLWTLVSIDPSQRIEVYKRFRPQSRTRSLLCREQQA
jgi:1,2-phenylacetyl-CoA epoxidase PaaB subunit